MTKKLPKSGRIEDDKKPKNGKPKTPKMPSMKHLPWSREDARQQKWLRESDIKPMFEDREVVVTEKLDGANSCITAEKVYARSHSGEPHREEWDYLKKKHREEYMHKIPEWAAVFGEYLYARHSIKYESLPSYFIMFGLYDKRTGRWHSWDMVKRFAKVKGFEISPVLYEGPFDRYHVSMPPEGVSEYGDTREGYVVRNKGGFYIKNLEYNMAKCVRENHVNTEELHWRQGGEIETNDLA